MIGYFLTDRRLLLKTEKRNYLLLKQHFRSFFEELENKDDFLFKLCGELKRQNYFLLKEIKILVTSTAILWLSPSYVVRIPLSHLSLDELEEVLLKVESEKNESKLREKESEEKITAFENGIIEGEYMFSVLSRIWNDVERMIPREMRIIEYKPQSNKHLKPRVKKQFHHKRDLPAYRFHLRPRFY